MNIALSLIGVIILGVILRSLFSRETVLDYECGLWFRKGLLKGVLPPGQYWLRSAVSTIMKVDMRLRTVVVPGQEVLSSDNVTIKITLAAQYQVADPVLAATKVEKFQDALYTLLQISLREIVGGLKIDELIAGRMGIGRLLMDKSLPKAKELGLSLKLAEVKDIMFPGELKKIFSQVVKAQKEGQAALEKARGESAALRNLANASRMLDGNKSLLQLRMLQSLENSTGNTMVMGFGEALPAIIPRDASPKQKEKPASPQQPPEDTEDQ